MQSAVNRKEAVGSPPRVRGKPAVRAFQTAKGRITPARAGKTKSAYRLRSKLTDHPRACGENYIKRGETPDGGGSPPRVRGKL